MTLGNIMIFGDSYSTYEGYIPDGFAVYYSGHRELPPDVFDVKRTWWGRIIEQTGSTLVQNNSWSGSTLGNTGYNNSDCSTSSSFIYRFEKLWNEGFFEEHKIDTLFVFGGTNDSWSEAPLGELKFENIEKEDLFCVLPAICYFAGTLKEKLGCFLVEMASRKLKPTEKRGATHRAHNYAVFNFHVADFPGRK